MRIALVRTYQLQMVDDLAQPLGIMALDAYLRTKGYDDIHLHDMRLKRETPEQAVEKVLALKPDLIGLSSLTVEKESIHQLTGLIKARAPHVIVVVGGPYATSSKRNVMRDPAVDYLVTGEGEVTFHELLETIQAKGDVSAVRSILYRDELGGVHETGERPYIENLDDLPLPSWDRIDLNAYHEAGCVEGISDQRWVVFDTSRGCPFKCTYCHDVFGKKFRARSPKRVLEEMELLYTRYGIRSFHVYDDIFNFNKKRVLEICRLIREKGWKINVQFANGLRADMMDLELLQAMKSVGTLQVNYAIESASPRIQKQVKKHLKLDRVRKLIEDTDKLGMLVHGYFMLGFPGETREEIMQTVEWACTSKLHTAAFYMVCPFEGTPLADSYVAPAKEIHGADWQYYDNPHSLAQVSADELKTIQRNAYLRFYFDPKRMFRYFNLLPHKKVLLKFFPVFVKIIGSGFKFRGGDEKSWDHAPESIDAIVQARRPMEVQEAEAPPPEPEEPSNIVPLRAVARKKKDPPKVVAS